MKANEKFCVQDLEFWANVRFLNQRIGYKRRISKKYPKGGLVIPTVEEIKSVFKKEKLNYTKLVENDKLTSWGTKVINYMQYRSKVMLEAVEPNLMDKDVAKKLFYSMKKDLKPSCPLPMNKQKGDKKDYAFLTCIVNMIIEQNLKNQTCNYDPKELTAFTTGKKPIRTLSRRVDGAFPSIIDPKVIWEIKEYYYTTTFGSRIADGVYETQLDGMELSEVHSKLNRKIDHYLIVDAYTTWWKMGQSYLCRLIDLLHMELVSEVIFGKEVIIRLPQLIQKWK